MGKDTDELTRDDLYDLCKRVYAEARKDDGDIENVCGWLEESGFSLRDLED